MPRHHHVNLGVPTGGLPAQRAFLTDVLGYAPLAPPPELSARGIGVHWFEGDDGNQIHLSEDVGHSAPQKAHVAVSLSEVEFAEVRHRLDTSGMANYSMHEPSPGFPAVMLVRDPAGNLWELRGYGDVRAAVVPGR